MANEGWTQTPNFILDNMANMKPAVFKVCMVVVRQTCGYIDDQKNRKEWDRLSTSRIMELAGLSNRAVIDAVEEAIADGWIERRPSGQYYEYRVSPMKKVHSLNEPTYENSSQVSSENSSQVEPTYENSSQEPMKKVHTQKKERNNNNTSSATQPPADVAEPEKAPTPQQEYFSALCWVIGWDHKTITKDQSGQVAQTVGVLQKAGYSKDDLRTFWSDVWAKDWRWEKKKQRPTLTEVRADIGKIKMTDQATAKPVPTYKRMKALN